jgi:hypothetical protein
MCKDKIVHVSYIPDLMLRSPPTRSEGGRLEAWAASPSFETRSGACHRAAQSADRTAPQDEVGVCGTAGRAQNDTQAGLRISPTDRCLNRVL